MKKYLKYALLLLLTAWTTLVLCACGSGMLQNARPINDVNALDGQRVGVLLGMGSDYLLTSRKDMTLMRYNTVSDMVLALSYRRIDALALDKPITPQVLSFVEGLGMVEEPVAHDGLVAYIENSRTDLLDEFNAFIPEFQQTEEYADLFARYDDENGFTPREVPLSGTGEILTVGITEDNYPFSYLDFTSGEFIGSDVEFLIHFANYYDYTLKIVPGNYEAMEMGVAYGNLDMAISGLSNLYREDLKASGRALITDIYMPMDIVFVEVVDPKALKIVTAIEY